MVPSRPASFKLFSSAEAVPTPAGVTTTRIGGFGARRAMPAHHYVGKVVGPVFRQKNYLGFPGKRFDIGGIGQSARTDISPDNFFKILFVKRNVSLGHFDHARPWLGMK